MGCFMALNSKGHVLLEVMVALISYAAILSLMVHMILTMNQVIIPASNASYNIAIKQLQWQISINSHFYLNEQDYCFDYLGQERCLFVKNKRLIMTPGTQIIMVGLVNMMLFEKEGGVYISGYDQNNFVEYFIGDLQ
jgi:hypothetical protein